MFSVLFHRSEVATPMERVRLFLKFRFRVEFSDFCVLARECLLCDSIRVIRLSAPSAVTPYWDPIKGVFFGENTLKMETVPVRGFCNFNFRG
jgi:hypothetical protein